MVAYEKHLYICRNKLIDDTNKHKGKHKIIHKMKIITKDTQTRLIFYIMNAYIFKFLGGILHLKRVNTNWIIADCLHQCISICNISIHKTIK